MTKDISYEPTWLSATAQADFLIQNTGLTKDAVPVLELALKRASAITDNFCVNEIDCVHQLLRIIQNNECDHHKVQEIIYALTGLSFSFSIFVHEDFFENEFALIKTDPIIKENSLHHALMPRSEFDSLSNFWHDLEFIFNKIERYQSAFSM